MTERAAAYIEKTSKIGQDTGDVITKIGQVIILITDRLVIIVVTKHNKMSIITVAQSMTASQASEGKVGTNKQKVQQIKEMYGTKRIDKIVRFLIVVTKVQPPVPTTSTKHNKKTTAQDSEHPTEKQGHRPVMKEASATKSTVSTPNKTEPHKYHIHHPGTGKRHKQTRMEV